MTEPLILVLDEGTTSTRAMLFTPAGELRGTAQRELTQHYSRPGWVEHDAGEIWDKTVACAREMVERAGGAGRIAAIGVTNQRETVVAWDRATGEPLARALVWQDRRTAAFCEELRAAGHEDAVRETTGLLLDPYFSATKMRWLLDNEPAVAEAARAGRLAFGTIESWLVFRLTDGAAHVSDAGNASRTLLLPLTGATWDSGLCDLFGVPPAALPEVVDSAGQFGTTALFGAWIPICGLAGDQQAATIGQGCLAPGETKATYGTGAFVLANKGSDAPRSRNRLLGTVLHQLGGRRCYALEGSVFVAGSLIQWLRDSLQMIVRADESEELARSVEDNAGVVVVPALSGLGAPHWRAEARGAITGLSFAATRAHVVRAALEAISHQTQNLADAFAADGAEWTELRIDGGMSANDWLAQDIADITALPVVRPDFVETTALGAAMLAAVGAGLHGSLEQACAAMIGGTRRFEPAMANDLRKARLAAWEKALAAV
uniref:glycerol kinase GlpK n=1 Tax=Altererythrobacter segetis TaxID=1104773 RepID=UPI00140C34E9|nr:glycerol kinase GlpK [Altererythrobacter segetis]